MDGKYGRTQNLVNNFFRTKAKHFVIHFNHLAVCHTLNSILFALQLVTHVEEQSSVK